jgi:integrase
MTKGERLGGSNSSRLDADLLTPGEIERLMRQCSRRAPTGVRNRALIAICWRCGLRIGEALALAVKDFDPDSGTLVVQRGKGGKRRVVGVDAGTVALVGRWLELRRKRGIPGTSPLFCTLAGKPIEQSFVKRSASSLEPFRPSNLTPFPVRSEVARPQPPPPTIEDD